MLQIEAESCLLQIEFFLFLLQQGCLGMLLIIVALFVLLHFWSIKGFLFAEGYHIFLELELSDLFCSPSLFVCLFVV